MPGGNVPSESPLAVFFQQWADSSVTLCSSGERGPHLAGPHRISKFFQGQNRQEPRLWKHPWGSNSAFTTLLNTFVRVYPLPVGPDGTMEPASQGSWGLGENAHEVLTTVPGTNVTLYPATLWEI